ncbi:glycoside hydrolase family 65 protein [Microbacterium sp. H83]|uniref:glycoside hydrolase family 65 protein n=1 Tax=Microbacterium sp. H83 TaxID=1827324 RepID=UPI000AB04B38|nr:glycosyl hydrolase family 65 protein [Microbacterium sp. H83]
MSEARFEVDPWTIGIHGLDADRLAHEESVFGLSNGHLGWRGNLDEGDPRGLAGSYLNGVFEEHPMPHAEDGYGYPDAGQSVINVQNGQIIRLLVDDEPFDLRHGELTSHSRRLDLRDGTLTREFDWTSPTGRRVSVRSTRVVSFTHRAAAAVRYEVEAVGGACEITVLSELLANEPLPIVHEDPRVQDLLTEPLETVEADVVGDRATLIHRTRRSGLTIAVTMEHHVDGASAATTTEADEDLARTTIRARLDPGERLDIVKIVAHEWSSDLSAATLRDRAETAADAALADGWDRLVDGQRRTLDDFWACADVVVEGEPRLQQAVRFALFQVFQAAVRAELRSVPGKGLTGSGYEGHTFWDFEAFVLPVLTATAPHAAEQALRWRHSTLGHARDRARLLHLDGASFAWRTIDGRESSGYWPASTAAFHINADVAAAVLHYVRATGDVDFERDYGLEILAETARLWVSLGRHDADGAFHIDGVTGPDEYSAVVNDNVFTNLMAQLNLRGAAAATRRHPDRARELGIRGDEPERWDAVADAMHIPFDHSRGVHPQSAGYTDLERWDFEATSQDQYLLQEHFPYFDLYRKQVLKQADLVLALHLAHEAFTPEEKARAFEYYEALTVRDSSLSASAQSVIAAEVGHLELAYDYLAEVATIDLDDVHGNTHEGLHMAALAGGWTAIVAGFGGMRDTAEGFLFRPRLPSRLARLGFGVRIHGETLRLDVTQTATTYRYSGGDPLRIRHFDEEIVLEGAEVTMPTPALSPPGARPTQPAGRAPLPAGEAFDQPAGEPG